MTTQRLSRAQLIAGLTRLDEIAREEGVLVEITLYGGAALALVYNLRESTRDVDVAIHRHAKEARKYAKKVAEENGWDENWLNDGVKGFTSIHDEAVQIERFPPDEKGLSVMVATPRYLFAMKCLAMRSAEADHPGDKEDIIRLAGLSGIKTVEEALDVVSSFYPDNQVSAKVMFGIQEIMGGVEENHKASSGPRPPNL